MSLLNPRLRKFLSFYKPYKGLFAADIFCALVVSAVSLTIPLCIRYLSGDLLNGEAGNINRSITLFALLMLGLVILQTACALFYDHMGHVMGARMERDMRNELFTHYQTLPFSFFDREKTGAVISRLINDLLSLAELYHHGPEDIIIYAFTFIGALVILLRINPPLALVICLFLPFMFLFALVYSKVLNRAYTKNRENIGQVSAQIEDSIAGIRTVKSFGNEAMETEKFRQANEALYRGRSSIYKHEARYYTGLGMFFTQLIIVIAVVVGAVKLSGATLGIADFISFILYVNYLTAPIPQLARISAQYQEGISGFNRFMDVMELPGENYDEPRGNPTAAPRKTNREIVKGDLEFAGVSFRYKDHSDAVLKDISFKIRSGEYVALTGPSGIGKTTLCSLIPRFYENYTGSILIDGADSRDISLQTLRRHIGIVQQENYVFAGSVCENIAYGKPGAPEGEIIAAAKKANAHDFIMALPNGYDTIIGSQGLSGGQRQRLCIARVFLKDPLILIFDEATSALDYESEAVVQEGLKSLSQNRTTLVIAHRDSTIRNAGRVLVLNGQSITEQLR